MIDHAEFVRLLTGLRQGDSQAQKALYDACYPDIAGYIIRRANSQEDAEEIIAEAFARCFRNLNQLIKPDQFRNWLYKLAYQSLADYYRKRRIPMKLLEKEVIETATRRRDLTPLKILLRKEWFEQFYMVLAKLPVDDRDYIISVLEGESLSDMAIWRGKSLAAVKLGIHRARIRLARLLSETPYFGDMAMVKDIMIKFANKDIK